MKKSFREFYNTPTRSIKKIWENRKTIFVFDTNIFLNLYSLEESTQNDFFSVLDRIKDRIWLPFHVGLEYQRRRRDIIIEEKNKFKKIKYITDEIADDLTKLFNKYNEFKLKTNFPTIYKKTKQWESKSKDIMHLICKDIHDEIDKLSKLNNKKIEIRNKDYIRDKLDKFFLNKLGNNFTEQTQLDEIYIEGERRYLNRIPPGYMDSNNKEGEDFIYDGFQYKKKFGDLIIFKQIIDYAINKKIENIIFITDDLKEDWWEIVKLEGEKRIGARPELKREIYNKAANVKELMFYTMETFLEESKQKLSIEIQDDTLNDIRNLSNKKETNLSDTIKIYEEICTKNLLMIEDSIKNLENQHKHDILHHDYIAKKINEYKQELRHLESELFELNLPFSIEIFERIDKQTLYLEKLEKNLETKEKYSTSVKSELYNQRKNLLFLQDISKRKPSLKNIYILLENQIHIIEQLLDDEIFDSSTILENLLIRQIEIEKELKTLLENKQIPMLEAIEMLTILQNLSNRLKKVMNNIF